MLVYTHSLLWPHECLERVDKIVIRFYYSKTANFVNPLKTLTRPKQAMYICMYLKYFFCLNKMFFPLYSDLSTVPSEGQDGYLLPSSPISPNDNNPGYLNLNETFII